jgi:acyl carrier protein
MTEQEIIKLTNDVFEESFEIEKERLKPEMNIFQDLGLDSLDVVDLVVALQEKFGVKIRNDERIKNIRTLGDIHKFILSLKSEAASLIL